MKKRLKKTLSMVLIMISILALFVQSAFAAIDFSEGLSNEIEKTNEKIFKEIEKTQGDAEKEFLKGNKTEEKFNEYLDKLIEKLQEKTDKTAVKLIEKAAKEGITLERTFIFVKIYDRMVEVDPFYAH